MSSRCSLVDDSMLTTLEPPRSDTTILPVAPAAADAGDEREQ